MNERRAEVRSGFRPVWDQKPRGNAQQRRIQRRKAECIRKQSVEVYGDALHSAAQRRGFMSRFLRGM